MSRRRIAQQYDDDYDDYDDGSYGSYGGEYVMSASPNTSQYMMSHASRGGSSLFDFVDEASHKKTGIDQCIDGIYDYLQDASIYTAQEIQNAAQESGGDLQLALALLESGEKQQQHQQQQQKAVQTPSRGGKKKEKKDGKKEGKKGNKEEGFFEFEEEDSKSKIIRLESPFESIRGGGGGGKEESLHDTMLERDDTTESSSSTAPLSSLLSDWAISENSTSSTPSSSSSSSPSSSSPSPSSSSSSSGPSSGVSSLLKDWGTGGPSSTPSSSSSSNDSVSSLLEGWGIGEQPSGSSSEPQPQDPEPEPEPEPASPPKDSVSSLLQGWGISEQPNTTTTEQEPQQPEPQPVSPPKGSVSSLLQGWGISEQPTADTTPQQSEPEPQPEPQPSSPQGSVSSLLQGWGITEQPTQPQPKQPEPEPASPPKDSVSSLLQGWGVTEQPTSPPPPTPSPPPSSSPKDSVSSLLEGWGAGGESTATTTTTTTTKDTPISPIQSSTPPSPSPSPKDDPSSLLEGWGIEEDSTPLSPPPSSPPSSSTTKPFPSLMAHILCSPPLPFDPHSLASYQPPKNKQKRSKCAGKGGEGRGREGGGEFTIKDLLAASSIRDIARQLYVTESHKMGVEPFLFDSPSPDDMVFISRGLMKGKAGEKRKAIVKQPDGPKKKASSSSSSSSSSSPSSSSSSSSSDDPAGLKRSDSKSPRPVTPLTSSSSPCPSPSRVSSPSSFLSSSQKAKKQRGEAKTKDLQGRFEKEKKDSKEHLNLVVIGHVDAGKSTIMGHLLYLIGDVSNKELHRFKVDSENIGKGSFHFAWVLDQNAEERERGVTMDISVNYFDTKNKKVTLLDAPGHRDFVPRMIAGAAQADVAILVINASLGEFEKGFESDGQTKEHAVLARSLGITRLIIAINKLDLEGWCEKRYREIEGKLSRYLMKEGFSQKNLAFLPCSGLTGENIKSFTADGGEWYKGPTLLEAIDEVPAIPRRVEKPFRMSISDVYSEISTGLTVTGKVESGFVMADDHLMIVPSKEHCKVKAVRILGDLVDYASAGSNVELSLKGIDMSLLHVGAFLCDPENPIRTVRRFGATIQTFDLGQFGVIRPGHEVVVHLNNIVEAGCLGRKLMIHDLSDGKAKGNEPQKKRRAKILGSKQTASIRIDLKKAICLELFSDFRQLGRFTLRDQGRTIAAGIVTEILS